MVTLQARRVLSRRPQLRAFPVVEENGLQAAENGP